MGITEPTCLTLEEAVRRDRRDRDPAPQQLKDENARLKRLVADLTLDKTMVHDVLKRKW
jgi:putative transposase